MSRLPLQDTEKRPLHGRRNPGPSDLEQDLEQGARAPDHHLAPHASQLREEMLEGPRKACAQARTLLLRPKASIQKLGHPGPEEEILKGRKSMRTGRTCF